MERIGPREGIPEPEVDHPALEELKKSILDSINETTVLADSGYASLFNGFATELTQIENFLQSAHEAEQEAEVMLKINRLNSTVSIAHELISLQNKLPAPDIKKMPFLGYFEDIKLKLKRLGSLQDLYSFKVIDFFPDEETANWNKLYTLTKNKIERLKTLVERFTSSVPQTKDLGRRVADKPASSPIPRKPPLLAVCDSNGQRRTYVREGEPLHYEESPGSAAVWDSLPPSDPFLSENDRNVILSHLFTGKVVDEPLADQFANSMEHIIIDKAVADEREKADTAARRLVGGSRQTDFRSPEATSSYSPVSDLEKKTDTVSSYTQSGFRSWYERRKKAVLATLSAVGVVAGIKLGFEATSTHQPTSVITMADSPIQTMPPRGSAAASLDGESAFALTPIAGSEKEPAPRGDIAALVDEALRNEQGTLVRSIKGKKQEFNKTEVLRYYINRYFKYLTDKQLPVDKKNAPSALTARLAEFKELVAVTRGKKGEGNISRSARPRKRIYTKMHSAYPRKNKKNAKKTGI